MQTDNEVNGQSCDNISYKNDTYAELTVTYWAWKNLRKLYPNVQYVGMYHYHRFFSFNEKDFFAELINKPENEITNYHVDNEKVINIFKKCDVIITKKRQRRFPASVEYKMYFSKKVDYAIIDDVIKNNFPDYYDAFVDVMDYSNKLSGRNMFIMRYDDFEKYCEWLFAVLSDIENKVPYEHNLHGSKIFAYISEYLINVWLKKNRKKLKFCDTYFYCSNVEKKRSKFFTFLSFLKQCRNYVRDELSAQRIILKLRLKNAKSKIKFSPKP